MFGSLNQDNYKEIMDSAATMMAGLGPNMPTFMAQLPFKNRVAAVSILDSGFDLPETVFQALIEHPAQLQTELLKHPEIVSSLNQMKTSACTIMAAWPVSKTLEILAMLADLKTDETVAGAQRGFQYSG
jgi:hypothetical protein